MGRYSDDKSTETAGQQNDDQVLWEKVTKTVKKAGTAANFSTG